MKNAPERYSKRISFLLWFLFAAFLLCTVQLIRYTLIKRDSLNAESTRIAWRSGTLPAPRGTLFAPDGSILAKTEIRSDVLLCSLPEQASRQNQLVKFLKKEFDFVLPEKPVFPIRVCHGLILPPEETERMFRK